MNAKQLLEDLVADHTDAGSDADRDWRSIPLEKRYEYVTQYLIDEEIETDPFSSNAGAKALQRILIEGRGLHLNGHTIKRLLHAALCDYQPCIDEFEKAREAHIDKMLDDSIIRQPDWDKRFDARF